MLFLALQLAALALFNPGELGQEPEEPPTAEKRSFDIPKRESPKPPQKEIISGSKCEIDHKDAISALSRASSQDCKNRIETAFCDHKKKLLLPDKITRTCKHKKTFIADGSNIGMRRNILKNFFDSYTLKDSLTPALSGIDI